MERSVLNDKFREELAFLCKFQKGHFEKKLKKSKSAILISASLIKHSFFFLLFCDALSKITNFH